MRRRVDRLVRFVCRYADLSAKAARRTSRLRATGSGGFELCVDSVTDDLGRRRLDRPELRHAHRRADFNLA